MSHKKLLIVEDDEVVANIYRNKFAHEGYSVEVATDGQKGIEHFNSFQPDLVLVDLLLPKMNGVELIKTVRSQPGGQDLPIVVFSNTYLTNLLQDARKAGATKCVAKGNCSPKELVEIIGRMLDQPVQGSGQVGQPKKEQKEQDEPRIETDKAAEDPGSVFLKTLPESIGNLRVSMKAVIRNTGQKERLAEIEGMYQRLRSLTGGAAANGFLLLAQIGEAVEGLLKELGAKPANINASTLRTLALATDFLAVLFEKGLARVKEGLPAAKVLVVDDEAISRQALAHALEKARLEAIAVHDPQVAEEMLAQTEFDLILLDVDMPGTTGFELCARLRRSEMNRQTPVVFVTALNDFESRANSMMSGGTDFIGKPFLFVELAVKSLVYILRPRVDK